MKLKSIDHLVLPVEDIERSLHFYTKILGMELDSSNNRYALKFGTQKINLHRGKAEFLPAAKKPTFGSADLCFLADGLLSDIKAEIEQKGIVVEEGIVRRTGAQGLLNSIYVRDPDGNLIEISTLVSG
ncbi:MAG: VOC family protein [Bacteroidaceae bacterium]